MATVVISPSNVVNFIDGGGHFWVYMQYAQGLRQLGCDVFWLEEFCSTGDPSRDAFVLAEFSRRMERYGLGRKLILYRGDAQARAGRASRDYVGMTPSEAEAVFRRTDLLLNFHYGLDGALLACFRRTALVDIDPGLLQFWISVGQVSVETHDLYFTTGETVGTPSARFSDCGLPWIHIRPPVCLVHWPYVYDPACESFTTVSNWYGHNDWIVDGKAICYENTKRVAFLGFAPLPRMTRQTLELALYLSEQDSDVQDRQFMERHGWRIRHSRDVAGTPEAYRSYIQASRGEFSCAKPSCLEFQNAWISDRTLCYLASGKPVVVQNTGPSSFLPEGEGLFRFSTLEEAVDALASINADYHRHCQAARRIAASCFDARRILEDLLNVALQP